MAPREPAGTLHPHDETSMIARVVESIQGRFPDVHADIIAAHVEQARTRYTNAPVRDYVPVMVEREVTEALRTPNR